MSLFIRGMIGSCIAGIFGIWVGVVFQVIQNDNRVLFPIFVFFLIIGFLIGILYEIFTTKQDAVQEKDDE